MRVYISGQITGLQYEDVKAKFSKAEQEIIEKGHEVVNPLNNGLPHLAPWELHMAMDVILLMSCNAIFMLPDWPLSKGATLEKNIAQFTGKQIIYKEVPAYSDIKQVIADVMAVPFFDIVGKSRARRHVYARMIYAHYCREDGATIIEIAKELKRDHATVNYYLKKYPDEHKYTPEFRNIVTQIEEKRNKAINLHGSVLL